MMAVNKELLPVKIHSLSIFSVEAMAIFTPSFVRQKGVPPDIVGLIWSMYPIITVVIMMIITNLADRFNSHRGAFLSLLIIFLASLATMCAGPDIVKHEEQIQIKYLNMSCQNGNVVSISNNTQLDDFDCASDLNSTLTNSSSFTCNIGLDVNSELNAEIQNLIENAIMNVSSDNINDRDIIEEITLDNQTKNTLCRDNHIVTCVNKCSSLKNDDRLNTLSLLEIITFPSFWLLLISLLLIQGSPAIAAILCNTAILQILGENSQKFGLQRVWGTIGFGIMTLVYGAAIDYFSNGGLMRNYSAGYIISMVLWVFAFISATQIKFVNEKEKEKEKEKESGSVLDVLMSFEVLVCLACVLVVGLTMGGVLPFLMLMIEDVADAWEPGFANLNLLQGLSMSISCFAGEVPIMFLSGFIIEKLGNVHTFTLVLAILGIRFISYAFIKNPWLFIPVGILDGISFGLYYPNMIAYVGKISPPGKLATMQGLMNCVVAAGMSIGALIGGYGYELFGGQQMFLYVGITDVVAMVIYLCCHMIINKRKSNLEEPDKHNAESGKINISFVNTEKTTEKIISIDNVKEDQDCQTKL